MFLLQIIHSSAADCSPSEHTPLQWWRMGHPLLEEKSHVTGDRGQWSVWQMRSEKTITANYPGVMSQGLCSETEGTTEETEEVKVNRQKMRFQPAAARLLIEQAAAGRRPDTDAHTYSVENWSTPWRFEDQLRILQHLLHKYYMTCLSSMAKSTFQPCV